MSEKVCHYARHDEDGKASACHGELTTLRDGQNHTEVTLCRRHGRCAMCSQELADNQYVLGSHQAYCCMPRGTKSRIGLSCGFRCGICKVVFGTSYLSEYYRQSEMFKECDDDEHLYCDDCLEECHNCGEYAKCTKIGRRQRPVCVDCLDENRGVGVFSE